MCVLIERPWLIGKLHHSFLSLLYGLTLVVTVMFPSHHLSRVFQWNWLCAVGRISYGIYLLHMGFLGAAHSLFFKHPPQILTAPEAAVSISAILAAIGAAYLSYRLMERRLIAVGQRCKYDKTV